VVISLAMGFAVSDMGPSTVSMGDCPLLFPEEVPAIPPCLWVAGAAQVQPCAGGVSRMFPGALGAFPRNIVMANGHVAQGRGGLMKG